MKMNMGFKLFCCALIVSCSVLAGLELRRRLLARLHSLIFFREYFRQIRSYISHVGLALDDIASELDYENNYSKFCLILREKNLHSSFPSAFASTLSIVQKEFCLSDDDFTMLCAFVDNTGSSDLEGAVESLKFADEQISDLIKSAKEKLETDGRLYVVLSLSCGAVAALLLL